MTKKNIVLSAVLVALVAVYVVFFTNWFKHKTIQIFDTQRQIGPSRRGDLPNIYFGLGATYELTDVKVVDLAKFKTDPLTPTLWHLVSDPDSSSDPVQRFRYGENISGMKPYLAGDSPESLDTNVTYRIFVSAGRLKGFHDFQVK